MSVKLEQVAKPVILYQLRAAAVPAGPPPPSPPRRAKFLGAILSPAPSAHRARTLIPIWIPSSAGAFAEATSHPCHWLVTRSPLPTFTPSQFPSYESGGYCPDPFPPFSLPIPQLIASLFAPRPAEITNSVAIHMVEKFPNPYLWLKCPFSPQRAKIHET